MVCVGMIVVHGFDPWQYGEFRIQFLIKIWPHTCGEWILETGHVHHPPHLLTLIPHPITFHELLFVCRFQCWRMCKNSEL